MVALVEHVADGAVAIHRIWLAIDGSVNAAFRAPRRRLGPVKGRGSIPLGELLMVGEGIETTAAVITATGWPGWATLSASVIQRQGGAAALVRGTATVPSGPRAVRAAERCSDFGRGHCAASLALRRAACSMYSPRSRRR
jgi:hypothetical protein